MWGPGGPLGALPPSSRTELQLEGQACVKAVQEPPPRTCPLPSPRWAGTRPLGLLTELTTSQRSLSSEASFPVSGVRMAFWRRRGGSQGDWEGNSQGPLKPWVRCLREGGGKAGRGMGSCVSHMSCPLQAPGLLPQDNGWGVSSLHQRLQEDAQATAPPTLDDNSSFTTVSPDCERLWVRDGTELISVLPGSSPVPAQRTPQRCLANE